MSPSSEDGSSPAPRQVILEDFEIDLPIDGGWGFSQEDACIIDANDPTVSKVIPFNGASIEHVFVEKRIYEQLIVSRPHGDRFSGISWNLLSQSLFRDGDRCYDVLEFEVEALPDQAWETLKAEWEGPEGYGHPDFDVDAHNARREEKTVRFESTFWFDITSFHRE